MQRFQQLVSTGFALATLSMVGLALVTWNFSRQSLEASSFVSHTHEVISAIGTAEATLYRAEAAQRAYLATFGANFQRERERQAALLRERLDALNLLTRDNTAQGHRLVELGAAVNQRLTTMQEAQQSIELAAPMSLPDRLEEAQRQLDAMQPMFGGLIGEELRLLHERELTEERRTRDATLVFALLLVMMAVLLPLTYMRLRTDLAGRQRAEAEAREERRFDGLHMRALTLFNSTALERAGMLEQTLELLAETGRFAASVFYGADEWNDKLQKLAARGAPSDTKDLVHRDDGPIGVAVASGQPLWLEDFDRADGLRIETGLATLRPAGMLFSPVLHQAKLHGVLVLAAATKLMPRDQAFVERLSAQLGVALHNLAQLQDLGLLAEELRRRGEEVAAKNAELERASRMKSEFLANMSHELRTPLNAVIGFSEILRDGLTGDLTTEQTEYVGDINSSGKHLLSLINDVLDLSKIEAGQMALELGAMEPAELMVSGLSVVRERAALRGVQLTELCEPGLGTLWVDSRRMKQIVINLLSNAVKFTPDGGTVSLSLRRVARARIDALREADDVRLFPPLPGPHVAFAEIAVRDSGIGIDGTALRQLFQPFMQIDSSLNRHYEGTGLGLTMVQRLAELHGGGLMVESRPGEGSAFTVWVPWRASDAGHAVVPELPVAPTPVALPVDPSSPLVLVIDDDPRAANLLRLQLEPHGYRVDVASNAEEGLAHAIQVRPDTIILDVILPGMDGWDMLAALRDHEATRHIPVVIVSIVDEPRRGFVLGASQVLVKPVTQADLIAALAAMGLSGPPAAGARVLVVDDDPKAVALVTKHLQVAGFETLAAYGGEEALQLVRVERPDVIVLDLMMPKVSGFDVVEALGRDPSTADIGILVLTAKLVTAQDRELLRGRAQRILEKASFQSASLLAEVKRAVAKQTRVVRARHAASSADVNGPIDPSAGGRP